MMKAGNLLILTLIFCCVLKADAKTKVQLEEAVTRVGLVNVVLSIRSASLSRDGVLTARAIISVPITGRTIRGNIHLPFPKEFSGGDTKACEGTFTTLDGRRHAFTCHFKNIGSNRGEVVIRLSHGKRIIDFESVYSLAAL